MSHKNLKPFRIIGANELEVRDRVGISRYREYLSTEEAQRSCEPRGPEMFGFRRSTPDEAEALDQLVEVLDALIQEDLS